MTELTLALPVSVIKFIASHNGAIHVLNNNLPYFVDE